MLVKLIKGWWNWTQKENIYQVRQSDERFSGRQSVALVHEDVGGEGGQGHHKRDRGPNEGHDRHQPRRLLQDSDLIVSDAKHLDQKEQFAKWNFWHKSN